MVFALICYVPRGKDFVVKGGDIDFRWSFYGLALSHQWCVPGPEVEPVRAHWGEYRPVTFHYYICCWVFRVVTDSSGGASRFSVVFTIVAHFLLVSF